jgi:hypothetical protein
MSEIKIKLKRKNVKILKICWEIKIIIQGQDLRYL